MVAENFRGGVTGGAAVFDVGVTTFDVRVATLDVATVIPDTGTATGAGAITAGGLTLASPMP